MATFRDHLEQLHLYFRNSANRSASLKAAAEVLGVCELKVKVPVTLALIKGIKDSGGHQPGSHLARLHQSLDDPLGLGAFSISAEQERGRRGQDNTGGRQHYWQRFQSQVMDPYLDGLIAHLERRFSEEWASFKEQVVSGPLKNKTQLDILSDLSSKYEEFGVLYPTISQLAAIALTVPVSSVNCERDFSTLNRVKTNIRNRLQGDHLAACMWISINGPEVSDFPYQEALETFFRKPRKIHCSKNKCSLCG
ncbi:hypothetical protein F7725_017522 [Dissostichus mawsoni]|uniref:HAT C-terminal dimerisation domain-containing protein n=1 Tax=Dissostichus mawsoni TaxID=36200 RepID=A0A7J5Z6P9_DISMA|nr:hypothetical protein F7725_017522 [Dissostichus mawsoni]